MEWLRYFAFVSNKVLGHVRLVDDRKNGIYCAISREPRPDPNAKMAKFSVLENSFEMGAGAGRVGESLIACYELIKADRIRKGWLV